MAGAVLALLALASSVAVATATPPGARLAIGGHAGVGSEVITTGPMGGDPQSLVADPDYWTIGSTLSWSADGSLLAFLVSGPFPELSSGAFGSGWSVVAVAKADGSGSRVYPRAFLNAGEPVMAPDGGSVVFQRVKLVKVLPGRESYLFKSAIWSLDTEDGAVRQLTRWRVGAFLNPTSFSPDGSTLAAEYSYRSQFRAVAIDLRSHRISPLALDASELTYSPDGARLAFIRLRNRNHTSSLPELPISELLVADADGTGVKRLLRGRGYISAPSWDPSGSRLVFTRNPPAEATGDLEPEPGNKVMAINADGTCLARVFTDPEVTLDGAAWQPGIGREAGPIVC